MKKVLIINWDGYPNFPTGGIYTWEKTLIESMPSYEFVVLNVLSNSNSNSSYTVPKNVKVLEVPIFGATRFEEYCPYDYNMAAKILKTTEGIIKNRFLPLYRDFLESIFSDHCNTQDLANTIIAIHDLMKKYDVKKFLQHPSTWDIFMEMLGKEPLYRNIAFKEALTTYQLLQRSIQLLAIEVPDVDIIHCSLAWFPSLVAVYTKKANNCPVIVTEHGVAYRELLLFYNAFMFDEPSKLFWKVVSHNIVRVVYSVADVITPVCKANLNWEEKLGADSSKIRVIYNGVNTTRFKPMDVVREDKRPTIATVARVDAFKDIVCLVQAVKYARDQIPDLQCLIYGTSTNLDYSLRCIRAVKDLELEDAVKFMGGTKEPEKVYNAADAIVISSITEGFPFTIIEAMACGKAIAASDVGGVREALEGCGLLVRSRRPRELAQAIVRLIQDVDLRKKFEKASFERVNREFTLEKCIDSYKKQYEDLIASYRTKENFPQKEMILQ
ncbi:MAG TPA: GT4 family glycosyltransferase PelF [Candidatus Nitrosotalea sp.]|nr:GT4 family glycosyltransferase PelF [Candidatus Nitrosotalea sp.]